MPVHQHNENQGCRQIQRNRQQPHTPGLLQDFLIKGVGIPWNQKQNRKRISLSVRFPELRQPEILRPPIQKKVHLLLGVICLSRQQTAPPTHDNSRPKAQYPSERFRPLNIGCG